MCEQMYIYFSRKHFWVVNGDNNEYTKKKKTVYLGTHPSTFIITVSGVYRQFPPGKGGERRAIIDSGL